VSQTRNSWLIYQSRMSQELGYGIRKETTMDGVGMVGATSHDLELFRSMTEPLCWIEGSHDDMMGICYQAERAMLDFAPTGITRSLVRGWELSEDETGSRRGRT
jgi:hypothetical protein